MSAWLPNPVPETVIVGEAWVPPKNTDVIVGAGSYAVSALIARANTWNSEATVWELGGNQHSPALVERVFR